ncbi:UDP-3-O-(3-hydroxymyristoyl)glucosamine N-acyltransferase [bacterium]|nr:UDP-3-O-(3-hydroxymyristoyl)glucosamine N-acyltransferase [candidate division CSSED10-310 bacterium]
MSSQKPPESLTLSALAEWLNAELTGEGPDLLITGMGTLDCANSTDISFLSNMKYRHLLAKTKACAVLVPIDFEEKTSCRLIKVRDAYLAVARLTALFYPPVLPSKGIHPSAIISDDAMIADDVCINAFAVVECGARIGANTTLFPGVYVGRDTTIGNNCILYPNVTVYHGVTIGDNVIVHGGAVLGSDGFGYAKDGTRYFKVPQIGSLVISDDVEIGANTTIDRGSLGATVVARGVKLDNLVHLAHNVKVGDDVAIAAQSGIAGSSAIGHRTIMGGQSGISGHVKVGDDVIMTARSAALKDIPDGSMISGFPPMPHREWKRNQVALRNIEKLENTVKNLSEIVNRLEKRIEEIDHPGKENSGDCENRNN